MYSAVNSCIVDINKKLSIRNVTYQIYNFHVKIHVVECLLFFPLFFYAVVKEELHNRFNLISEERVKFFKHNSENLMKIG